MDRLSSFASREEKERSPEERQRAEEAATAALLERLSVSGTQKTAKATDANGEPLETKPRASDQADDTNNHIDREASPSQTPEDKSTENVNGAREHSGIPENVKLFEIFHEQVMNLVSMQRLPIQDITALLVSLANLAL